MLILFAGITLTACGETPDLQKQMSGVWESRRTHEAVELQLSGDSKSVTIAGNTYPASLDMIDNDKGEIHLKVNEGNGKDELWLLKQMWEDSDRFSIIFERGKIKEVLIPKNKRS
jgi:hypothetical protein